MTNFKEAAITFLETVDLHSLNLASLEEVPPALQRTTSTPHLKNRTPSLPIDSADPLNALPPDTNDSALKSLAGALEASYKLLWNKLPNVDPPRTLDDVRRLISRPFSSEYTESPKDHPSTPLSKLIVGTGVEKPIPQTPSHHPEDSSRTNLMFFPISLIVANVPRTSGFRTLGTSLSRPFSSTRTPPPPTPAQTPANKLQREMQDMVSSDVGGLLTGTQSRQIIPVVGESDYSRRKIRRVDSRLLEMEAGDVRVRDVEMLVRELRRVVVALDELGGFEDP